MRSRGIRGLSDIRGLEGVWSLGSVYVDVGGQRGVYGPGGMWGLGVCSVSERGIGGVGIKIVYQ